jgi:hypothetical protein
MDETQFSCNQFLPHVPNVNYMKLLRQIFLRGYWVLQF